jgi:hypothetical protein
METWANASAIEIPIIKKSSSKCRSFRVRSGLDAAEKALTFMEDVLTVPNLK